MYCRNCGAPVAADQRFCMRCGKAVGAVGRTGDAAAMPGTARRPNGSGEPRRWSMTVATSIMFAASVIVLGYGAFTGRFDKAGRSLPSTTAGDARTAPQRAPAPTNPTALERMVVTFAGSPSEAQIKEQLEKAMRLYDLEVTEQNRLGAGSALLRMRHTSGFSEMELLDYMIRSDVPEVRFTFAQGLVLAAAAMKSGDR